MLLRHYSFLFTDFESPGDFLTESNVRDVLLILLKGEGAHTAQECAVKTELTGDVLTALVTLCQLGVTWEKGVSTQELL